MVYIIAGKFKGYRLAKKNKSNRLSLKILKNKFTFKGSRVGGGMI